MSDQKPDIKSMLPPPPKNIVRFTIPGITDTIANLKQFVAESSFDDGLKAYLTAELSKMKSNAARIDMHDLERPDGGFNLHLTVAAVHLGKPAA